EFPSFYNLGSLFIQPHACRSGNRNTANFALDTDEDLNDNHSLELSQTGLQCIFGIWTKKNFRLLHGLRQGLWFSWCFMVEEWLPNVWRYFRKLCFGRPECLFHAWLDSCFVRSGRQRNLNLDFLALHQFLEFF